MRSLILLLKTREGELPCVCLLMVVMCDGGVMMCRGEVICCESSW